MKLLCALARLYEVTILQPLRLEFFGINFPLYPCSKLPFITFRGQVNITSRKARRSHDHAPLPNLPTPETSRTPSTFHLSPTKVSERRAPLEECFPCVSQNHLYIHSRCSSFDIAPTKEGGSGYLIGGGVFRIIFPTGGRCCGNIKGGDGPITSAPRPVG